MRAKDERDFHALIQQRVEGLVGVEDKDDAATQAARAEVLTDSGEQRRGTEEEVDEGGEVRREEETRAAVDAGSAHWHAAYPTQLQGQASAG